MPAEQGGPLIVALNANGGTRSCTFTTALTFRCCTAWQRKASSPPCAAIAASNFRPSAEASEFIVVQTTLDLIAISSASAQCAKHKPVTLAPYYYFNNLSVARNSHVGCGRCYCSSCTQRQQTRDCSTGALDSSKDQMSTLNVTPSAPSDAAAVAIGTTAAAADTTPAATPAESPALEAAGSSVAAPAAAEEDHPFETDPGDHAETPAEAYEHLDLLLTRLAK